MIGRRTASPSALVAFALAALVWGAAMPGASAEGTGGGAGGEGEVLPPDVRDAVARSLFERAIRLYHERKLAEARQLFSESEAASPGGPYAPSARDMVRRCEEELGLRPRGDGRRPSVPAAGASAGEAGGGARAGGADPAAATGTGTAAATGAGVAGGDAGEGGAGPIDPYLGAGEQVAGGVGEVVLDPYGELGDARGNRAARLGAGASAGVDVGARVRTGEGAATPDALLGRRQGVTPRRQLLVWGGAFGTATGIGLAGVADAGGTGALLALGGAGAGVGVAHLLTRSRTVGQGPAAAAMSLGTLGLGAGLLAAHVGDAGYATNDPYSAGVLLGGTLGLGAGMWWALGDKPSTADVVLVDSMTIGGLTAGLLVGGLMQPAEGRAYSLNALLGAGVGLASGLVVARRAEVAPARLAWLDLGAAAGAAAGWLLYPLFEDEATGGRVASVASLGLAGGGAWLAWRLGGKADAPRRARRADAAATGTASADARRAASGRPWAFQPASPALLGRDSDGRWRLGAPLVRPVAAPGGGASAGAVADVLAGCF